MFRFWWYESSIGTRETTPSLWWLWLAFGLSCVGVGVALVIWPQLLSIVVASIFVAAGMTIVSGAISSALDAWQRRPRHIHVRRVA